MALTTGYVAGKINRFGLTGGKVLANEIDSKLSIKSNFSKIADKDNTNGSWVLDDVEYSVTVSQNMKFDTDATRTTSTQMIDAALAGTSLPFTWAIHTTASTPAPNSGDLLLTGALYITGNDLSAPLKSNMKSDITLMGSGTLVKSTAV